MARLRAFWHDVVDSLWFLPTLFTLGAGGLALGLIRLDTQLGDFGDRQDLWWLFGGGAEGARGVLGAIAGSIMTVTGVVFSVTIVALQLASSQYTPRLLRQFMADRANQAVLGVFIGTFTYALLVQRSVRGATEDIQVFVPAIAVTGALALALVSIGVLIFFINHSARSMQVSVIIDRVVRETRRGIDQIFPEEPADDGQVELPADPPQHVTMQGTGYLQAVAHDPLLRTAERHGALLRLVLMPGDHALEGQPVATVWRARGSSADLANEVRGALHFGLARTPHHDPMLGVIELVDVGVKALSPSINDPTTAINVIDRLGEVLLDFARRPQHERLLRDDSGTPRVLLPRPNLRAALDLAVDQLRHFGASNPAVTARLAGMLGTVGALAPPAARAPIIEHIERTLAAAGRSITDPGELARVEEAGRRALAQLAGS
jgi:uncharacterized membrane protein